MRRRLARASFAIVTCGAITLTAPNATVEALAAVLERHDGEALPGAGDLHVGDVSEPHLIRAGREAIELAIGMLVKNPCSPGIRR
jgi:hypothetical protein